MDLATATAALPDTADDAAETPASDLMHPPAAAVPALVAPADADGTPAAAALESPEQQAVDAATKVSAVSKQQLQRGRLHFYVQLMLLDRNFNYKPVKCNLRQISYTGCCMYRPAAGIQSTWYSV